MNNNLLEKIATFKEESENFTDILVYFNSKIKYLGYKLKYPEAETDLIIYLYELLKVLDQNKFETDKDLLMYVNRCLKNKSIALFYKIAKDKEFMGFTQDEEILDGINCEDRKDEYSDIIFNDLISSLNLKQKQTIFNKFYLQLSDVEIAKKFNISRQAVNKTQRLALRNLKIQLSI